MKSKYAELFTAKLNDMDLVLFEKHRGWGEWALAGDSDRYFVVSNNFEYFLCLPQHKDACLHWLNGGESQYLSNGMKKWINFGNSTRWSDTHLFMTTECEIRIKPKKEKRWIGYCASRNQTIPHPQDSEQLAMNYTALHYSYHVNEWQFIEIEVEV